MHTGSLVDWLTLLVLSVNARFIWLYLKKTNKIRIANEAQLEAQNKAGDFALVLCRSWG
jgi:hypothetical protein